MKHFETPEDVLASARVGLEPSMVDRARVRQRLLQRAATIGAVGTVTAAKSAAAGSLAGGSTAGSAGAGHSLLGLAKVFASTFVLAAAGATTVVAGIESVTRAAYERDPSNGSEWRAPTPNATKQESTRGALPGADERDPEPEPPPERLRDAGGSAPGRASESRGVVPVEPTAPKPRIDEALNGELRLLQEARGAVTAGHSREARHLLTRLDERYPAGLLMEERSALRVVTNCSGASAATRARLEAQFLRAYPGSVYAARVRLACGMRVSPAAADAASSPGASQELLTDQPPRGH